MGMAMRQNRRAGKTGGEGVGEAHQRGTQDARRKGRREDKEPGWKRRPCGNRRKSSREALRSERPRPHGKCQGFAASGIACVEGPGRSGEAFLVLYRRDRINIPSSEKLLFRCYGHAAGPGGAAGGYGAQATGKKPESANKFPAGPLFRKKMRRKKGRRARNAGSAGRRGGGSP